MLKTLPPISEESYRFLLESVENCAIYLMDLSGRVIGWGRGAEQLLGYTKAEIIGRQASVFYPAEEVALGKPEQDLQTAKKTGRLEQKALCVRKNGTAFQANIVITVLQDEKGNPVGFGSISRTIAKENKTEEVQRLNEELENRLQKSQTEILDYKHALDESAIVAITDQKGIIHHVNKNFCNISKYSREELIGQDHRIINSGYHSKEFIRNLWVTIANGRIWRGELKNKAKDGSFYWVDTTIVPFLNEQGKPYQYLAIRSDITQRKLAEEQLYKINEELESKIRERTFELTEALEREKELGEMKSRFVSLASHEFRTPLSAILSSTSLLEHYTDPEHGDKRRKHIERIKSSIKNLTDILDDFLSLDKLEQGKVEAKNEDFNLREFMEDVIEDMSGVLKRKSQTIRFEYQGEEIIHQDKKILRNILLNLLSNAVKYSPEEKEIQVIAHVQREPLSISVRDEGIGIPPEAQKELFGKFYRASNAAHIQGTGLGLNIVKRYIELLSGAIEFCSEEKKGTTFTIYIPRNKTYRAH